MFLVSIFAFYALWCGLVPLWYKNQNLGFLRLLIIVPIRTVFGTGAVLLGLVVAVASVRNFTGVVLGTGCVFSDVFTDLLWSDSDNKLIKDNCSGRSKHLLLRP